MVDDRVKANATSQKYSALVWKRFKRNKMAFVSLWLIVLLVLATIFAEFFSPSDPVKRNSSESYLPPQSIHFIHQGDFSFRPFVYPYMVDFDPVTFEPIYKEDTTRPVYLTFFSEGWEYEFLGMTLNTHLITGSHGQNIHFLGTDGLGRDVYSRILNGMGSTLTLAVLVMMICVTIGTFVGIASGYYGGRADMWIQRLVELMLAFPELPLFLSIITILPKTASPYTTFVLFILVLGGLKWAQLAREIRGKTLSLREIDYVRSAIAVGASDFRVIVKHIFPNVTSHVIVVATAMIPQFILVESFLSFLGVGIQPPMVSLGLLLNAARDFSTLGSYPWLLSPVLFILVAVLVFNAAGDGLRDAVDPYSGN